MQEVPKGWTRTLYAGCLHAPIHDPLKLRSLLALVREMRPDRLVVLGDMFEADAASRFDNEMDWDLKHEFAVGNRVFRQLESAAPGAELVFVDGNHEDNLARSGRVPRKLRGLTQIESWVPALEGWKRLPYINGEDGLLRFGQTTAFHGWSAAKNSDNQEALLHGREWGLSIRAHTHRPTQGPVRVKAGVAYMNRWFVNVGTMCDIRFFKEKHYGRRLDTSKWGFAPAVVDADETATNALRRRWRCFQFWFDQV